jgi:hypothetical protein
MDRLKSQREIRAVFFALCCLVASLAVAASSGTSTDTAVNPSQKTVNNTRTLPNPHPNKVNRSPFPRKPNGFTNPKIAVQKGQDPEIGDTLSQRLQKNAEQKSKFDNTLSNILKKEQDTQSGVTKNIK